MYLGLDVGGTHTDAVIIKDKKVIAAYKAETDYDNLLLSITKALEEVTKDIDKRDIDTVNLSTTLSTNAIVEDKIEDVGVIVSSGPGIDPENYKIGNYYSIIDGSIDHRGKIIKDLEYKQIKGAIENVSNNNISVFAAVTKFSTRNPDEENYIEEKVSEISDFTTLGHRLSGQLNFPRRIATAYYNSAVWRIYNRFSDAISKGIADLEIDAKINILKADGGTMPFEMSKKLPVESILSGPAASIMGIISLCDISEDSIILDIGGTTTDIAIFSSGSPLVEREGISLNSSPTLVRALQTKSIGIGGDSALKYIDDTVQAGPERKGCAIADGGKWPTVIDALNFNKIIEYGDIDNSVKGIEEFAVKNNKDSKQLADDVISYAVDEIKYEVDTLIEELNNRPVYTIHDMLEGKKITPTKIYIMGGPAKGFTDALSKKFDMDVIIPENYSVANAVGAALAKITFDIELFADTSKGVMLVPNLNVSKEVSSNYDIEDAENDAVQFLTDYLADMEINIDKSDVEIIESSSFRMVQDYFSSGKDLRVKCQIKPGVVMNIFE